MCHVSFNALGLKTAEMIAVEFNRLPLMIRRYSSRRQITALSTTFGPSSLAALWLGMGLAQTVIYFRIRRSCGLYQISRNKADRLDRTYHEMLRNEHVEAIPLERQKDQEGGVRIFHRSNLQFDRSTANNFDAADFGLRPQKRF